jgi:hypothetical protein
MPTPRAEDPGAAVRVHLGEKFTPAEAGALHRLAGRVPRGTTLDVDFSGVRTCHDVALLLLASDVRDGAVRFLCRGLTHHQARLLAYLGAPVPSAFQVELG